MKGAQITIKSIAEQEAAYERRKKVVRENSRRKRAKNRAKSKPALKTSKRAIYNREWMRQRRSRDARLHGGPLSKVGKAGREKVRGNDPATGDEGLFRSGRS